MQRTLTVSVSTSLAVLLALSCEPSGRSVASARAESNPPGENAERDPRFRALRSNPDDPLSREAFEKHYPWSVPDGEWPTAATLQESFRVPPGYERVSMDSNGWGKFLRQLPLRLDRSSVRSYAGETVAAPAAAVALLPVGDRDLQQCADAILRLRAEFLWHRNRREEIAFHFTSGDRSAWSDWAEGERFRIEGARVDRIRRAAPDRTRPNFLNYLRHLFTYAGTRSLSHDTRSVGAGEAIRPGDIFVDPGSPGHAVLVLDVAENPAGERIALLGQSFMPAQEFHVLESPNAVGGAWFRLPQKPGGTVNTPSWQPFERRQLRRFPPVERSQGGR